MVFVARLVVYRRGGRIEGYPCRGDDRCDQCSEALRLGGVVVPCRVLLEFSLERYERPEDVKWFVEV